MRFSKIFIILILTTGFNAYAQLPLTYFLGDSVKLNPLIPTPEQVLGFQTGQMHVSHDQLVYYMYQLANASSRVEITQYGRTSEYRPLLFVNISMRDNLQNLDNLKNTRTNFDTLNPKQPLVFWIGASIHGDEASSGNAALLMAYYLAASEDEWIKEILNDCIILLDPCQNPDGFQRYANWVNQHHTQNVVPDTEHREHNEPWPGGRYNHYWSDLNRDWLLLEQKETQARIKQYHDWKPHVLLDLHEMQSDRTFFYQPGKANGNNSYIPQDCIKLTQDLAEANSQFFVKENKSFFSGSLFDDFYPGKGSTYADLSGSIGILFEQASSKGSVSDTQNGPLSFEQTIQNQMQFTFRTLITSHAKRDAIIQYQYNFFNNIPASPIAAFVITEREQINPIEHMIEFLLAHDIEVYRLKQSYNGLETEKSIVVPVNQAQSRLIQSMFDKNRKFDDSVFYDVSAWAMDLAYNVELSEVQGAKLAMDIMGKQITEAPNTQHFTKADSDAYAYHIPWTSADAPKLLYKLLLKKLNVYVVTKPNGNPEIGYGDLLIFNQQQSVEPQEVISIIDNYAAKYNVAVRSIMSPDVPTQGLGHPGVIPVKFPKILLLTEGADAVEVGENWQQLDAENDMFVTLTNAKDFSTVSLDRFTTIIMASGSYSEMESKEIEKLTEWVSQGGILIAEGATYNWLSNKKLVPRSKSEAAVPPFNVSYADSEDYKNAQRLKGVIYEIEVDVTHPLFYGYNTEKTYWIKNNQIFMPLSQNPAGSPAKFLNKEPLAGFVSSRNSQAHRDKAPLALYCYGKGEIIVFADSPNFRNYWKSTKRVLLNAIFYGSLVKCH